MESEEEKAARLAQSSLEQPSTSRAVSPPHLDGLPSPKSPNIVNEDLLLNSNHATADSGEAGREVGFSRDRDLHAAQGLDGAPFCILTAPREPKAHSTPSDLLSAAMKWDKESSRFV